MFKLLILSLSVLVVAVQMRSAIDIFAVQACSADGKCPAGKTCINNACVDSSSAYCPYKYVNGDCTVDTIDCPKPVNCINGRCCMAGKGSSCTAQNSAGACTLGNCPGAMSCINGMCCP